MFHSHVGIVNSLVKFVQLYDFFFDFVAILNICQIDLKLYVDLTLAFND
jgi:hypothetical protein